MCNWITLIYKLLNFQNVIEIILNLKYFLQKMYIITFSLCQVSYT